MDASHLQQWQEQLVELPPLHEADGAFSRAAHLVQQHQDRDLIGRHPVLNAKQVGVHNPVGHHRADVSAPVDAGSDRPARPATRRAHEPPYAMAAPARHLARPRTVSHSRGSSVARQGPLPITDQKVGRRPIKLSRRAARGWDKRGVPRNWFPTETLHQRERVPRRRGQGSGRKEEAMLKVSEEVSGLRVYSFNLKRGRIASPAPFGDSRG